MRLKLPHVTESTEIVQLIITLIRKAPGLYMNLSQKQYAAFATARHSPKIGVPKSKRITKKEVKEASLILIYVSCNDEVNTIPLIKYFIRKGIPIAVPKVSLDKMDFYYIKSLKDLKKGYKGIYEPVPNNLVTSFNKTVSITPGICFNKKGYRVGYGKGFYDKFYQC